jgi:muramoyltetrapeptide carboxypeptidase LdcA involved in peptidoglycan recycling
MPIRPPVLQAGDTVAVISPSAGLTEVFGPRFERGLAELRARFGVEVVTAPNARRDNAFLHDNPRARADDVHWALGEPSVAALICAIGGDDSVRLVPHLDLALIRENPKVLMGYSDPTILHMAWRAAGVVSFYGPGILAGFDENGGLWPHTEDSVRRTLFSTEPVGALQPAPEWTEEFLDWHDESLQRPRRRVPNGGWTWLGGADPVEGPLVGGCLEVLAMALTSAVWPPAAAFDGAVLAFETSEEAPSVDQVKYFLRAIAGGGAFERLAAIVVGRPMHHAQRDVWRQYEVTAQVAREFGRPDLPIVGGLDIGHTVPHTVLPLGMPVRIDPGARTITLPEPAVVSR